MTTIIRGIGQDTLKGGPGADILDGGWGEIRYAGPYPSSIDPSTDGDIMDGGKGDDWYYVSATNASLFAQSGGTTFLVTTDPPGYTADRVVERAGGGIDTVVAAVSYTLPSFVENLILDDRSFDISGTGNELNNRLTGNADDNFLRGLAGNDVLLGGDGDDKLSGGIGKDTMDGGNGIDTLVYSDAKSGVTVDLSKHGFQNTGGAGLDRLIHIESVRGSGHADRLTGDGLHNTLDGGAGNDVLSGGGGNDILVGGTGNDMLRGGAGFDILQGGLGNDIYNGGGSESDAASFEGATRGIRADLAVSGAQNTREGLDTFISIEDLIGSKFADTLFGTASANQFVGGAGNDFIYGRGGADTLVGGAGSDRFYFDTALTQNPAEVALITDFVSATDVLVIDHDIFSGLANLTVGATLANDAFAIGSEATTASERILFDDTTGALFYDADGSDTQYSAVQFASLSLFTEIHASDFVVG